MDNKEHTTDFLRSQELEGLRLRRLFLLRLLLFRLVLGCSLALAEPSRLLGSDAI